MRSFYVLLRFFLVIFRSFLVNARSLIVMTRYFLLTVRSLLVVTSSESRNNVITWNGKKRLKLVGKKGTFVVSLLLSPSRFKTQYGINGINSSMSKLHRQLKSSGLDRRKAFFFFLSHFDTPVWRLKWEQHPAESSRVLMWEGNWSARRSPGSGDPRCRCDMLHATPEPGLVCCCLRTSGSDREPQAKPGNLI